MLGLGSSRSPQREHATTVPPLPVIYESRPRLLRAMAGVRRLRVLCAPAGYGKTALLSEWLQAQPPGPAWVWLSLGGQAVSLEQVVGALTQSLGIAVDADGLLRHVQEKPCRLVLDDLPEQCPAELDSWMERLLALPVQVLVTCRRRPNWNLPRLMLDGHLLELDAAALALQRDESDALIERLAPDLGIAVRNQLWHDTQGWCAGLRLLLLAPRHERALLREYLEHEVLARLDPPARDLLHALAHLPKVSEVLCEQIWEDPAAGLHFRRLLQCHAFLFADPAHDLWYRLLPAVADVLQPGLGGAALSHLRLRSCRLLGAFGHYDEAIEQALSASQPEVAANYMERLRLAWLLTDRHLNRLLTWRDKLPMQLLDSTPRLISLCARALLISGRLDESQACLHRLGHFLPQPDPDKNRRLLANWQALFGALQAYRGDAEAARVHCQAALAYLGSQDWLAQLLCHSTLARLAMIAGELAQAEHILAEAVELARRQGCLDGELLINTDRFRLLILQGELPLAAALLHQDLARVGEGRGGLNPLRGRLLFMQGELLLLQGRSDDAEQVLQAGLTQVRDCSAPFVLHGYLLLTDAAVQRADLGQARLWLYEGERRMHCGNIDEACYQGAVRLHGARILAAQQRWGAVLTATQNAEGMGLPPLQMPTLAPRTQLLLAEAQHHLGNGELASRTLRSLLLYCEQRGFAALRLSVQRVLVRLGAEAPEPPVAVVNKPAGQDELTPREVAVLKLLAQGMSVREVGHTLFISVNTVKSHAKNINAKLGTCRRTQAINCAKEMGILA